MRTSVQDARERRIVEEKPSEIKKRNYDIAFNINFICCSTIITARYSNYVPWFIYKILVAFPFPAAGGQEEEQQQQRPKVKSGTTAEYTGIIIAMVVLGAVSLILMTVLYVMTCIIRKKVARAVERKKMAIKCKWGDNSATLPYNNVTRVIHLWCCMFVVKGQQVYGPLGHV